MLSLRLCIFAFIFCMCSPMIGSTINENSPLGGWGASSIPDSIWSLMQGKSVPSTCTVGRAELRYLKVLHYGKVDGAKVSTDLTYDEREVGGRFWAKYDSGKSDIYVLVDKASGHVVNGRLSLIADEVGALPSLSLLDGFKSAGQASLDLTFRGEIANLNDYKE